MKSIIIKGFYRNTYSFNEAYAQLHHNTAWLWYGYIIHPIILL
jgi:hypothetical protein